MADDLFAAALEERLARSGPLAARLRPRTLDEIVGQRHLLGPGRPLRALIEADRLSSVILWGPPGTGKTTLAHVMAATTHRHVLALSAVSAGVKDVREAVEQARRLRAEHDRGTILFLDEVHRFNKAQQDALLPAVESGLLTLIGATTENPFFEVNAPLLSRSTLFRLEPLEPGDVAVLVERALEREGATAEPAAVAQLAEAVEGDARAALTTLEVALAIAGGDHPHLTADHVERARSTRVLRHGRDEHYDVVSALIKSVRGGDPDAGLHWLARMIVAGEDARYIARRLVVLASEDVGMADPSALVVATAAAHAVEYVGLPEAQLNLAQAVVHLATAPKSNRTAVAVWAALDDVRDRPTGAVPPHLRDSHYRGAESIGHGAGYRYPHDDPRGWVEQAHLPDELAGRRYYRPSSHGAEAEVAERLARRRGGGPGGAEPPTPGDPG